MSKKCRPYRSHSDVYTPVEVWIYPRLLQQINLLRDKGKIKYGRRINLNMFIRDCVEWYIDKEKGTGWR
jgi:hypothetical protein